MVIVNWRNHLYSSTEPGESYWLMRRIFSAGLGLIYFNSFLIFFNQSLGLYGTSGILPIQKYSEAVLQHFGSLSAALWQTPSLFLFEYSDLFLRTVPIVGIIISLFLVFGYANFPMLFMLWLMQMSFVQSGQIFYSFGWETQLLELTFLSFFLFPLWNPRLDNPNSPPKKIAIYFQRWMMFRLMLGAGLIKLRGDACWTDLTCLDYHYETQPNPLPTSWLLHKMPAWAHQLEVIFNHFVEIVAPFGLFGPKKLRRATGVLMIFFQCGLIISGNLAWLNWLTILMAIPCFDDEFLMRWLPVKKFKALQFMPPKMPTLITLIVFSLSVLIFSIQPAINLFSTRQLMNTSYSQFHFINSYGAFGHIGKTRYEVVISGTTDPQVMPTTQWKEYGFKCKPGFPDKRPCVVTPYHYKLDWQIWFSAMQPQLVDQWLSNFAIRLLEGSSDTLDLIETNPFAEQPPKFLKMDLYKYEYTNFDEPGWWKRQFVKTYLEPIYLTN